MKQPMPAILSRKKEFVKLAQVYTDYAYALASVALKNSARYDSIWKRLLKSRGLEKSLSKAESPRKVTIKVPGAWQSVNKW